MSGLRVRSLALANVGVLRGRIDFGVLDPAITLITGANEVGKSTTVQALRAALFERHSARHAGIKALQPHGTDLSPEVWVEFDLRGRRYRLHKRFLGDRLAELTVDGEDPRVGDQADQAVWETLGSQRPNNRGAKREDMGLWGLLWVSQDEAAFKDPASTDIGAETRGLLQEAISRQVGSLVGGRYGEHLRARVADEARRYWTPQFRETGELAAARARLNEATQRHRRIERAIEDVEDLAGRHASLEAQIAERARLRPTLERELQAAREQTAALQVLRQDLDQARQRLELCEVKRAAAAERAAARAELRSRLAEAEGRLQERQDTLGELESERTSKSELLAAADRELATAREERDAARAALDRARADLGRARAAAETRRLRERLVRADALVEQLEQLTRQREQTLPDAVYERILALDQQVRAARTRLEALGTRLRITSDEGTIEQVFGRARSQDLRGLGAVHVAPAQAGLGEARDRLRAAEAGLSEALRALGLESVAQARRRRAERVEAEVELERQVASLGELAPRGVEALAEEVAAQRESSRRTAEQLELAKSDARRLEELREQLAASSVDERIAEGIVQRAQAVAVAQARLDAIGTHIEVRALRDVELDWAPGEPEPLAPGASTRRTLTRPATLVLDDRAELTITPGGEDVAEAGARLDAARGALDEALRAAGVQDAEAAQRQARRWRELHDEQVAVAAALAQKAPSGLDALRAQSEERRTAVAELEERLGRARAHDVGRRRAEARRDANPASEAALQRLTELDEARRAAREAAEGLAAEVTLPGSATQVVLERAALPEVEGIAIEILPGEGGAAADAELRRSELALAEQLDARQLPDLATATLRWKEGLSLDDKIEGAQAQLATLAPEGTDPLREAVAALTDEGTDDSPDLRALEERVSPLQTRAEAAEARLAEAQEQRQRRSTALATFEAKLRSRQSELDTQRTDTEGLRARIASARGEASDDELDERARQDQVAHDEARAQADQAARRLDEASPALLDKELERATRAQQDNVEQERDMGLKLARIQALLDAAAAEGHFEELGDAAAELDHADAELRRVLRAAEGARRLAEEVERAHAEAQRRFLAPVIREARPYLSALRPGSELRMTPELQVASVVRRGAEESFDSLSGGTREQLSVIVRLALARVLARDEQSEPLPLILDDTMGWTDEGRFLQMTRILRDASKQFQLLVLTCHPSRFERLQAGRTIDLDALRDRALET